MKNFLFIKPKSNINHGGTDFIVLTCRIILKEIKESLNDGLECYIRMLKPTGAMIHPYRSESVTEQDFLPLKETVKLRWNIIQLETRKQKMREKMK